MPLQSSAPQCFFLCVKFHYQQTCRYLHTLHKLAAVWSTKRLLPTLEKSSPTHICHGPSRPPCDTAIRLLSVIIPQKPIDTRHILILRWKIGRHGVTFHRVRPIFLQVPLLSFEALDSHPLWPHIAKGVPHFLIRTKMGMKPGWSTIRPSAEHAGTEREPSIEGPKDQSNGLTLQNLIKAWDGSAPKLEGTPYRTFWPLGSLRPGEL